MIKRLQLSQLGKMAENPNFVEKIEREFSEQVQSVLTDIGKGNCRLLLISGPTGSGKTTFSHLLTNHLTDIGKKAYALSLDDYYVQEALTYDVEGRPDFESESTIEFSLFIEQIMGLLRGEKVALPTFIFAERRRHFMPEKVLQLAPDELLIVEGLHGLSNKVLENIDNRLVAKIFICPEMEIYDADKLLFSSDDLRKIRRLCRDVEHRGSTAISTLDYWPMIKNHEEQVMPIYRQNATYYINSALAYESCVLAPKAIVELGKSKREYEQGTLKPSDTIKPGHYYANLTLALQELERLLSSCKSMPVIDKKKVPPNSVLQEFI